MINRVGNVDRGAIMSEEFWHVSMRMYAAGDGAVRGPFSTSVLSELPLQT